VIFRARSVAALPDAAYKRVREIRIRPVASPFESERSAATVENAPLVAPIKPSQAKSVVLISSHALVNRFLTKVGCKKIGVSLAQVVTDGLSTCSSSARGRGPGARLQVPRCLHAIC
jgi:hypothetical protein